MDIEPYLMPLFAAGAVAVAGLVAIPWLHRDRPPEPGPDADDSAVLRLVVLGYPGSGKTALLAAMFHSLSQDARHGITLRTDPAHELHQDQHDQLRDLSERFENLNAVLPFPNAQHQVQRYALAFDVSSPEQRHALPVRLAYLDYSGEHLRDSHRPPGLTTQLARELAAADVILGLVDGAKIASMMRSDPDTAALTELRNLFKLLNEHREKTIQVVLTKWDLLAADDRDLGEVVRWIEQRVTRFKDLRRPDRDSPVRIIPTSAFGLNGFMKEPAAGRIQRDPARTWQPFQAGLPVACAVNEVLGHEIRRLTGHGTSDTAFTPASVSPFFAWAAKVLGLVTVSTDLSGNVQFSLNLNALDRYQGLVSPAPTHPPASTADASTEARSLHLLLRHCRRLTDELDHAFPDAHPR